MSVQNSSIIKPSHLSKGSTIAVVAPGFTFQKDKFENGIKTLREHYGFKVVYQDSIFDRDGYFAGTDERRLNEMYHWMTSENVDAIIGARGGYGCTRIYPELISKLKKVKNLKPKVIYGYSDLTTFLNGFYQDLNWTTFHGPVVVSQIFQNTNNSLDRESFEQNLLSDTKPESITHPDMITLSPGKVKAPLVGGCLSLVSASIGTSFQLNTKNKILFIEDVGERPYRIDRMLIQCEQAGLFNDVSGIIFGEYTNCNPPTVAEFGHETFDVKTVIVEFMKRITKKRKIPIVYNFPAGHGSPQCTLAIGTTVEIDANSKPTIHFHESGCQS